MDGLQKDSQPSDLQASCHRHMHLNDWWPNRMKPKFNKILKKMKNRMDMQFVASILEQQIKILIEKVQVKRKEWKV